jgi:uncharacterized protein YbgA (DUF1722 family)
MIVFGWSPLVATPLPGCIRLFIPILSVMQSQMSWCNIISLTDQEKLLLLSKQQQQENSRKRGRFLDEQKDYY